uniref:Nucleoside phosphatase GDA1/CD39 n=1 Tax=Panagrellus redivivus TaxID=6233 RepID=A0A7E4V048_PANRE
MALCAHCQFTRCNRFTWYCYVTCGAGAMARMEWKLRTLLAMLAGLTFIGFLILTLSQDASAKIDSGYTYGIIIDAGSTGSRLFLYRWLAGSETELIKIEPVVDGNGQAIVMKVSPGLSTFGDKPSEAPVYIKPLIEYAYEYIPIDSRKTAAFFLFATAGMRLLPIEQQNAVMNSLRSGLPKITDLNIVPDQIKVIDGKWEGIYNWIAANFILGRFEPREDPSSLNLKRKPTVGMIDMGGASTQIAFELVNTDFTSDDVQIVNLGASDTSDLLKYKLFVTTFLGYGVNEGAKKYEKYLSEKLYKNNENDTVSYVRDGCLPVNLMRLVTNEDGTQYVRKGTGEWDTCVRNIAKILTEESPKCPNTAANCFFGGIASPPLRLSEIELYGFSEYWYSVEDVLALGGVYNHTTFESSARSYCSQRWPAIKSRARAQMYPRANEERLETQCFKSAWIHAILHDGFFVDENKHKFQSANKIANQEVQWALGAMIYHMRGTRGVVDNEDEPKSVVRTISEALVLLTVVVALLFIANVLYKNYRPPTSRSRAGWNYHRVPEGLSLGDPRSPPRNSRNYVSFFT